MFLNSFDFVTWIGLRAQLGPFKAGVSVTKDRTTDQSGMEAGVAGILNVQVVTKQPPEVPINSNAGRPQLEVGVGPYVYNTKTHEGSLKKGLEIGLGAGVGAEFVFNEARYKAISAKCGGVIWGEQ